MSREAKIGLLGLLGIITFFILVPSSNTRDSRLLHNTYKFVLDNGNRISEGSEVKLAGYSIGQIAAINFTTAEERIKYGEDARIIVTVNTDAGVRIPEDSTIGVDASRTGNIALNIQPGVSETMIAKNTTVQLAKGYSSDPAKFSRAEEILTHMSGMTKSFRTAVSSKEFQTNLLDLASNARFYTNEAKIMTSNLSTYRTKYDKILDKYEGLAMQQIDRINVQVDLGAKRLQEIRPKLNDKLSKVKTNVGSVQSKIDGMLATAQTETERFKALSEKAEQGVNNVMSNPEYREKLRHAAKKLDSLATTCEDIHSISSDASVREGLKRLTNQYREEAETIKNKLQVVETLIPGDAKAAIPRAIPSPVRVDSSAIIEEPSAQGAGTSPDGNAP